MGGHLERRELPGNLLRRQPLEYGAQQGGAIGAVAKGGRDESFRRPAEHVCHEVGVATGAPDHDFTEQRLLASEVAEDDGRLHTRASRDGADRRILARREDLGRGRDDGVDQLLARAAWMRTTHSGVRLTLAQGVLLSIPDFRCFPAARRSPGTGPTTQTVPH